MVLRIDFISIFFHLKHNKDNLGFFTHSLQRFPQRMKLQTQRRLFGIFTLCFLILIILTLINFFSFFAKSLNTPFKDHIRDRRLNLNLESPKLNSFKSFLLNTFVGNPVYYSQQL